MNIIYDKTDPISIENYAQKLVNQSLGQLIDASEWPDNTVMGRINKGGFGQALEQLYFKINPGSSQLPDFVDAGVELKTSPLRNSRQGNVSKERLVLNIIDYCRMADETWESSAFLKKNALLLLVFYLHQYDISFMDYIIDLVSLWKSPPSDLKIIKEDWLTIQRKILEGKAHELSEGDTNYLAACTKGATSSTVKRQPYSDIPAKQRALSFKQKYINYIYNELIRRRDSKSDTTPVLGPNESITVERTFEEIVIDRFTDYISMSVGDIQRRLSVNISPTAKNFFDGITRAMLGVRSKRIEEFDKADIVLRTIRLKANGMPKEDISFPAFDYIKLIEEDWEDSDFRSLIERRFLFVVYQYRGEELFFKKALFWTMPYDDRLEAQRVWEETIRRIKDGRCDSLPKKSESTVAHVRPHCRDSSDVCLAPDGRFYVKKSFWLNSGYVKTQVL